MLWGLRGIFGALIISLAMLAFQHFQRVAPEEGLQAWVAFFAILVLGVLVVVTDLLVRDKQITTVSALYVGLLLGLLLGNILSSALDPFLFDWDTARDARTGSIDVQI